jgi:hypothetical protein
VAASNAAPWHGHWNWDPANCSGQPWWAQVASNATKRPRLGWTMYAGSPVPGSVNEAAPPTGTDDADPIAAPTTVTAVVGTAVVGGGG